MKNLCAAIACLGMVLPFPAYAGNSKNVKVTVIKQVTVVKRVTIDAPYVVPVATPVAVVNGSQIFYGVTGQPCPGHSVPQTTQPTTQPSATPESHPAIESQAKVESPSIIKYCGKCHIEKSEGGLNFARDLTPPQVVKSVRFVRAGVMPKDEAGKSVKLTQPEIDQIVDELLKLLES